MGGLVGGDQFQSAIIWATCRRRRRNSWTSSSGCGWRQAMQRYLCNKQRVSTERTITTSQIVGGSAILSPIHTARARCPPAVVVIDVVAPVEIVVVPVAVAAMMTTIRASQPDQQARAIAWRPRCKFPWPPDLARLRPWLRPLWPCERHSSALGIIPARPVGPASRSASFCSGA